MPGKVELLALEQVRDIRDTLVQPFQRTLENGARWRGVAFATGHLRQARTQDVELLRVRLKKQQAGRVERIEVTVEESRRQFVIELVMRELGMLQQSDSEARDIAFCRVIDFRRE